MWKGGGGCDGVGRQKVGILILIRVGADLCYFDADLGELKEGCSHPGPVVGSVSLLSTKWNLALISLTPSALE